MKKLLRLLLVFIIVISGLMGCSTASDEEQAQEVVEISPNPDQQESVINKQLLSYHITVVGAEFSSKLDFVPGKIIEVISSNEDVVKVYPEDHTFIAKSPGNSKLHIKTIHESEEVIYPVIMTILSEEQANQDLNPISIQGPDSKMKIVVGKKRKKSIRILWRNETTKEMKHSEEGYAIEQVSGNSGIATIDKDGYIKGIGKGATSISYLVKIDNSKGLEFLREIEVIVE